jgi:putative membrane protein
LSIATKSESFYRRLIYFISAVVFLLILFLSRLPKSDNIPSWAAMLPLMNAFLNGSTAIILIFSLYFIRKKNITVHRRLNIVACVLSTVFLLSYVTFHSFGVETKYPSDQPYRQFYYFVLITHIILAAVVLPLVLLSLYRGLTNKIDSHKRITRWSFPIWLYVTISGVIVYLMISPYYSF